MVGTIDTGVADVPDLAGKVDARWTVAQDGTLTRDPGGNDVVGHGTAVASLIAANVDDGFGMAGFGGATHLIAVRAQALTDTEVAVALMKLDRLGVRIVNMSFGEDAPEAPILRDAIHKAAADGMLLVAAAGNSAAEVAYPAADLQPPGGGPSYGLAVGATDVGGNLASFSNSGEQALPRRARRLPGPVLRRPGRCRRRSAMRSSTPATRTGPVTAAPSTRTSPGPPSPPRRWPEWPR